ncbi:type II toxin-antitoxin system Phd/YefM family antitoxin [Fulvimarina endophytica]|uniref:Antitoxin n=1 Tax=Fulvimarina endophytica TaxID=2293836 RepID=A0A371WZW3_9HYPH|nr:type II toxin-antitoxin system prevent-host-death family antitoxin [Fulvimarina endophytica]RFC62530.1 type II toxin-antitoxin system Phd/YefM family antitoxin [Fulvimarina endophytica]
MQVTVHAAKTHLSKLIEAAHAGEEVVIAKGKLPVAKIVPIPQGRFAIGLLKGKLTGPGPDFFEPMDESDLALWEGAP